MREEFLIVRNGKQFVLYAGLLDEAHTRGLTSIETFPEEVVFDKDGEPLYASFRARVTMNDEQVFSGFGDATRGNVGGAMRPHLIRMAETRAKARALRDAINVGVTAFEELEDHDSSAGASQRSETSSTRQATEQTISDQQKRKLEELAEQLSGVEALEQWLKESHGKYIDDLTRGEAAKLQAQLQQRVNAKGQEDEETLNEATEAARAAAADMEGVY